MSGLCWLTPRGFLPVLVAIWLSGMSTPGSCAPAPKGELVDIGGFRLHIQCEGEGLPIVVLDSGLGGAASDWRKVQPALAKTNRTCIYDRAGYGHSDSGPLPRSSGRIAAELRTLLMAARLPPPFVLVGHSFGGYNVRLFAGLFPQDTAGVVLIDAPHEAQTDAIFDNGILRLLDPKGRLRSVWSPALLTTLPTEYPAIAELFGMRAKTWQAVLNEAAAFDMSGQELQSTPMPRHIPVGVLMHGRRIFPAGLMGEGLEQDWLDANRALVQGQERGHFAIAPDSGHFIHAEEPDRIVEMVREIMEMSATPH